MKNLKVYIISFAVSFLAAFTGGIVTYLNLDSYNALIKPPLSPPSILFPIVWTILFSAMAVSSARVYLRLGTVKAPAMYLYGVQLLFNVGWSVLFFGLGAYLLSFIWLILLWALVLAMIIVFYGIDKPAGLIQIPYLLWLSFAAYLNLAIYLINFA